MKEVVSVQIKDSMKGTLRKKGTYEDPKTKMKNDMLLESNMTRVGMSKGVTLNMGGYQSARIDIWISKPCENNNVSIEETLNEISSLIDERLEYEVQQLDIGGDEVETD